MRLEGEGPLTLTEFIRYLTTEHTPCESIRHIWNFEGAWMAGHEFHRDDFPMEQALSAWTYGYTEWLKVLEEYK